MTQKLYIAMPVYTGVVHLGTFHSLIAELGFLNEKGIACEIREEAGNAMIAHSRNMFLANFLDSDCTDLIFVDDDVQWEPGAMYRLLSHDADIVAGIYPKRSDPLGFNCRYRQDRKELQAVDPTTGLPITEEGTGLIEVEGVPMGFTRITRRCLEKMIVKYPQSRFYNPNSPNGYAWALFDNLHEGDVYFGEDYSFCRRWFKMGEKVWVDPNIGMGHVGYKMFWGKFGDWLKSRVEE